MPRSAYRIEKVDATQETTKAILQGMHATCFPDLELQQLHGHWWIAYDPSRSPVAFAGLWPSLTTPGAGYLCRAGVIPSGRGKGLQRRLIRVREREATRQRWIALLSDVDPKNAHSMNNLFAAGYRAFRPAKPWCGEEWVYLRKIIDEGVA
jgi:GNAT superfamily N-acetyltransferase